MSAVTDDAVLENLGRLLADPAARNAMTKASTVAEAVVVLAPFLGGPDRARKTIDNLRRHLECEVDAKSAEIIA